MKNKCTKNSLLRLWPILAMFWAMQAEAIPSVRLELSTPSVVVGDDFSIDVIADGVTDIDPLWGNDELLAFGFDVLPSPTGIDYLGASVAAPFFDDSWLFSDTDVAGSAFPGVPGDDILLAQLNFTASLAGDYWLEIASDPADLNEGLFTLLYPAIDITAGLNVKVSPSNVYTVPEPPAVLLMSMGLLVMIVGFPKRQPV